MLAETYYLGYGVGIIVALVAILVASLPQSFDLGPENVGAPWVPAVRAVATIVLLASLVYLVQLTRHQTPVPRDQMPTGKGRKEPRGDEGPPAAKEE